MATDYQPIIKSSLNAKNVFLGKGVVIEEGVTITGLDGPMDQLVLGDFCFIGEGSKVICPEFRLGDYSKLHAGAFCHGYKPLRIGRNCWFGGNVVLDSVGGLDVDDNVGVGAQSQLWTHIQFGDIVEGARFHSNKYMHVGKDAWFVGHCIVSPVTVGARAMAMVGSVVTNDMKPNHVYGGVPAKDLTDKLGPQFEDRTLEQKADKLNELIDVFCRKTDYPRSSFAVITDNAEREDGVTCFNVADRTYSQTYSAAEVDFLKANVPLVKFTPAGSRSFIFDDPDPALLVADL